MDLWNNLLLIDGGLMLVGIPFLFILRGRKNKANASKRTWAKARRLPQRDGCAL